MESIPWDSIANSKPELYAILAFIAWVLRGAFKVFKKIIPLIKNHFEESSSERKETINVLLRMEKDANIRSKKQSDFESQVILKLSNLMNKDDTISLLSESNRNLKSMNAVENGRGSL